MSQRHETNYGTTLCFDRTPLLVSLMVIPLAATCLFTWTLGAAPARESARATSEGTRIAWVDPQRREDAAQVQSRHERGESAEARLHGSPSGAALAAMPIRSAVPPPQARLAVLQTDRSLPPHSHHGCIDVRGPPA